MPTLRITIKMDNEAFGECSGTEAARILRWLASVIEGSHYDGTQDPYDTNIRLRDLNGNTVGDAKVTR